MNDIASPLLVQSQAYCLNDRDNHLHSLIHFDYKFTNPSAVFEITQLIASVVLPPYEKIISSEYLTNTTFSDGHQGGKHKPHNVKTTVTNGSRNFSIACLKIKPRSEISLSVTIKVSLPTSPSPAADPSYAPLPPLPRQVE